MASLALVSLLVNSYDDAIDFYTKRAGFHLHQDNHLSDSKRWVVLHPVAGNPPGSAGILIAQADGPQQAAVVGNQGGGRVWLFLHVDDFWARYESMKANGVEFEEEPRNEVYGWVCVWKDLYGNRWDLLESK